MTSHTTTVPTYKYLGLVVSEEKIFQVSANQNLEFPLAAMFLQNKMKLGIIVEDLTSTIDTKVQII
jgi:hypothetical protein